jgi:hypothetical protein
MIVSGADAVRVGVAKGWCATRKTETETVPIVQEPSGDYRRAAGDETPDATIELGPSPLGCFLRISLDPERNPIGESVAPRSIRALQFADRELGTRFHADRLRACE